MTLTPYVKTRVSTGGKCKLISFEIPGVSLFLLQEEGKPLQAFSERPGHDIENLFKAAKYNIDLEMASIAGVRYMKSRIEALQNVKLYLDALIANDKIDYIKRESLEGRVKVFEI